MFFKKCHIFLSLEKQKTQTLRNGLNLSCQIDKFQQDTFKFYLLFILFFFAYSEMLEDFFGFSVPLFAIVFLLIYCAYRLEKIFGFLLAESFL